MNKIIVFLLGVGLSTFLLSCEKEDNLHKSNHEEKLIELITNSPTIEAVSVNDLPSAVYGYVKEHHKPFEIELAFHVTKHGYEVFLENGLCLYFDQNGSHLNHNGMHGDMGNHHGGGDHGINFCLAGDTLNIDNLPQNVINYISTNYTGNNIITVVVKPSGNLCVEISNGDILLFNPGGIFFLMCDIQDSGGHGHEHNILGGPGWHCNPDEGIDGGHGGPMGHGYNNGTMGHGNHGGMDNHSGMGEPCWGGTSSSIDEIPNAVITYLNSNHHDTTIEHIMQSFNRNYFLRLSNCARLVFDEDGNILFDSGG